MIISIHQPQYFPWINFFLKAKKSNTLVLLDDVNYQKNGLQNRNQLKNSNGRFWLTVPVKNSFGKKIKDIEIDNSKDWKNKHFNSIYQAYNKTKFFKIYKNDIEDIFKQDWQNLNKLNYYILKNMFEWLKIDVEIIKSSDLNLSGSSNSLLVNICKKLNAKIYLTGEGAENYLDENIFLANNLKIKRFQNVFPLNYPQQYLKKGFYNDLSAIDIIFNCGENWLKYINE